MALTVVQHLGPNIHPTVEWTALLCGRCGNVAGHYKYRDSQANRDKSQLIMRVWDPERKAWGIRAPYSRAVRHDLNPDQSVWISMNRECCKN